MQSCWFHQLIKRGVLSSEAQNEDRPWGWERSGSSNLHGYLLVEESIPPPHPLSCCSVHIHPLVFTLTLYFCAAERWEHFSCDHTGVLMWSQSQACTMRLSADVHFKCSFFRLFLGVSFHWLFLYSITLGVQIRAEEFSATQSDVTTCHNLRTKKYIYIFFILRNF